MECEPGIGKTALLEAALGGVDRSTADVARGQCDELGRRFPLSIVLTARVEVDSADPLRFKTAAALAGPAGRRVAVDPESGVGDAAAIAIERSIEDASGKRQRPAGAA